MPRIVLTTTQKELLKTKLGDEDLAKSIINMVDAGINTNCINNTTPKYVAMTDYFETINGNTITSLTTHEVKAFFEIIMGLAPKHINALRDKGIIYLRDLANFDSDNFDSVIRSVKGEAALPDLAQIRLKQACDFFQYVLDTGIKLKYQYRI